jgi:hypothetical protein
MASLTRGRTLAAFTAACLQTHLASRQEKRVVVMILILVKGLWERLRKPAILGRYCVSDPGMQPIFKMATQMLH